MCFGERRRERRAKRRIGTFWCQLHYSVVPAERNAIKALRDWPRGPRPVHGLELRLEASWRILGTDPSFRLALFPRVRPRKKRQNSPLSREDSLQDSLSLLRKRQKMALRGVGRRGTAERKEGKGEGGPFSNEGQSNTLTIEGPFNGKRGTDKIIACLKRADQSHEIRSIYPTIWLPSPPDWEKGDARPEIGGPRVGGSGERGGRETA